jgi:hypothetical protein
MKLMKTEKLRSMKEVGGSRGRTGVKGFFTLRR